MIFNIDSGFYSKYVKSITLNLTTKNSLINSDKFISSISKNQNINSSKELIDYINTLHYPTNAIHLFRDLYNMIEFQLRDIKNKLRKNYTRQDMSKCMKAVTNISSFYKNIFTIILNVYNVQMSILNINNKPIISESVVDKITNMNINLMLQESEHILQCNFINAINTNNINLCEYKDKIIPNIKKYLQNLYEFTMTRIEKGDIYTNNRINIDFNLYKQNLYRSINETSNSDEYYIENIFNKTQYEYTCISEGRCKDIDIELRNIKDTVKNKLTTDYNTIISYINKLYNDIEDDNIMSNIYQRPFNKLGVYSDDIYNYYIDVLSPISHIVTVNNILVNYKCKQENIPYIIKDLENHFRNDYNSFMKYKSYIMELYNFYNSLNYLYKDIDNITYKNYYMDDKLLSYISYFEDKVNLI